MIDNIDEPLPIAIDKANSFSFNSYARGYHAYMKIWNPVDGEVLVCTRETDNPHDNYAVSVVCCRSCYSRFVQGFFKLLFSACIYHVMHCHWKKN